MKIYWKNHFIKLTLRFLFFFFKDSLGQVRQAMGRVSLFLVVLVVHLRAHSKHMMVYGDNCRIVDAKVQNFNDI